MLFLYVPVEHFSSVTFPRAVSAVEEVTCVQAHVNLQPYILRECLAAFLTFVAPTGVGMFGVPCQQIPVPIPLLAHAALVLVREVDQVCVTRPA